MRLSAYKRYIDDASKLPESIGDGYFKGFNLNPKAWAIRAIIREARLDVDGIFNSEFIELCKYPERQK